MEKASFDEKRTRAVLEEFCAERARQNELWGEQDLPVGNARSFCAHEMQAKERCRKHVAAGALSYFDICAEEFWETFAADDLADVREEAVQLGACVTQLVERIDRLAAAGGR